MDRLTLEFDQEKETKGTFRYREVESDRAPVIGTLYLKKFAVGRTPPVKLRVTVEDGREPSRPS